MYEDTSAGFCFVFFFLKSKQSETKQTLGLHIMGPNGAIQNTHKSTIVFLNLGMTDVLSWTLFAVAVVLGLRGC